MQITALSAVWQMDFLLLPSEFKDFVAMVDFHNENVRFLAFLLSTTAKSKIKPIQGTI